MQPPQPANDPYRIPEPLSPPEELRQDQEDLASRKAEIDALTQAVVDAYLRWESAVDNDDPAAAEAALSALADANDAFADCQDEIHKLTDSIAFLTDWLAEQAREAARPSRPAPSNYRGM